MAECRSKERQKSGEPRKISYSELGGLELLAEGGFGIVYKGTHATFGEIAYKELKATIISENDEVARRELLNEARQEMLDHPNIVKLLAITFELGHYGCVFEFVKHGALDTYIQCNTVNVSTKLSISHDVARGMNYLHTLSTPVIHGDLKIQNVLIGDGAIAKICDFGLTKWKQYSKERTNSKSMRGTVTHIPPENWENMSNRKLMYDVYSFGIFMWELFTGKRPFENAACTEQIRVSVIAGHRPDLTELAAVDNESRPFVQENIENCWAQEPRKRPPFEQLIKRFDEYLFCQPCASADDIDPYKFSQMSLSHAARKTSTGAVSARRQAPERSPAHPTVHAYRDRPMSYGKLDGPGHIVRGLARLHCMLYVVYLNNDFINIYRPDPVSEKYNQKAARKITVKGMKNPTDMSVCSINKCLYVADPEANCVWKLEPQPTDRGRGGAAAADQFTKMLCGKNTARLSVTHDGRIVTLVKVDTQGRKGNETWRGKVHIYNPDGRKFTAMTLPQEIVNPQHVVQTIDKTFVVSHGDHVSTDCHRVCEVNGAGQIIACFGGSPDSGQDCLNGPLHVVLVLRDRVEWVIVADSVNRRIRLLDRSLKFLRELITELPRDDMPSRLFYDSEAAQLIVGLRSGRVEVFKLT